MIKPKIGLLPLYLELYDKAVPQMRTRIEKFRDTIAAEIEKRGIEVAAAPVCRLKNEFACAVEHFENERVNALVTLHMAYSPSLESAQVLAAAKLPVIILDTTETCSFGPGQSSDEIVYNHGIHGVQDMCNLLLRNRKPFHIAAGHWEKSDVLDRIASLVRSATLAGQMRNARVGILGEPFKGMGDFAVPFDILRSTIGIETVKCSPAYISTLMEKVDAHKISKEMDSDASIFAVDNLDRELYLESTRVSLAVRKWLAEEKLTAFTMNFLAFDRASGIPAVPFLEAGKSMARGIGYAGEGDVLTAALVGALSSVYPETTFTEMFCPDWEGDSIFVSHMGELNINLAEGKPRLIEMDFPYTDACNPVFAAGRLKGGKAVLVNLAPGADNTYTLLTAPVHMLDIKEEDGMQKTIRGWLKPAVPVSRFLEDFSLHGGTHHSALVYGDVCDEICRFGEMMDWKVVKIEKHLEELR